MNKKTVKKKIVAKLEDWLSSINDINLRKDVKKSLLLSGGSIASLLTNQNVNDYDIYIQDKFVLKRLVNYYASHYDNIEVLDHDLMDDILKSFKGDLKYINNARAIAVRTLTPGQMKLYFSGSQAGYKPAREEGDEGKKYLPSYFSPNAISLTDNIQIVIRFWGTPEQIHKTFDFIHATNYFTFEEGLVTNIAAVESLLTKTLKYQGSFYPLTSIIRMKKFIKRGWNINAGEILKILYQVSALDLTNPDVLEEQIIGVDVAYFSTLIEILRNTDKEKFGYEYLSTIIDKVFDESEEGDGETVGDE